MRALAALLRIHGNRMVMLESLVAGKLCSNQDGQVAANAVDYFSSLATSLHGDTTLLNPGQFGMTIHQPYGVVAAIVPWNAPLVLTMNKVRFCSHGHLDDISDAHVRPACHLRLCLSLKRLRRRFSPEIQLWSRPASEAL